MPYKNLNKKKAYIEKNKEKNKIWKAKYYLKNKEKILNKNKIYYEKNKEKILNRNKIYYKNNRDIVNKTKKEWAFKNQDKVKKTNRNYFLNNKEDYYKRTRAIKRKYKEVTNAQNYAQKQIPLKTKCEICGSTKNLQRHHWRYDKPLLVNTLCIDCHSVQHIKNFYNSRRGCMSC